MLECPADRLVTRQISVPAQAEKFLSGVVSNQIERLSPWPLNDVVYGMPAMFTDALALPLVCIPLTAAVVWFALLAWRNGFWTRYGRIQYTVIAATSVAFLWSLYFWNLLGFKFG